MSGSVVPWLSLGTAHPAQDVTHIHLYAKLGLGLEKQRKQLWSAAGYQSGESPDGEGKRDLVQALGTSTGCWQGGRARWIFPCPPRSSI